MQDAAYAASLDGAHGLWTGLAIALEALHVVQEQVAHIPVAPVSGQLPQPVHRVGSHQRRNLGLCLCLCSGSGASVRV